MVRSAANTVEDYLSELPEERRAVVAAMRGFVLEHLPKGYREAFSFGMLSYVVPIEEFPDTYNGQPLPYVALAAQKNHYALYLTGVYGDEAREAALRDGFGREGKKLDFGKSCVRFRRVEDLALDALAASIASMPPAELIAKHEAVHGAKRKRR